MNICIFAGTYEGRTLAKALSGHCTLHICVATQYGGMLDRMEHATVHVGRMEEEQMEAFFREHDIATVIDATHPYAVVVSQNVKTACRNTKVEYVRLIRPKSEAVLEDEVVYVEDTKGAVEYLQKTTGNVFLTTGVKELLTFAPLGKERLYARIIPSLESLSQSLDILEPGHILAALGPFSKQTNLANLQSTGARYLVTKESGQKGGFLEKMEAAKESGVIPIVIGRPTNESEGQTLEDVLELFSNRLGIKPTPEATKLSIHLIGCGSGTVEYLPLASLKLIQTADLLIGAKRLVEGLCGENKKAMTDIAIWPQEIADKIGRFLFEHKKDPYGEPEINIAVLLSGDTGFYSGTKKLLGVLQEAFCKASISVLPGISSVSLLSAKTGVSWEDASLVSMHGREFPIEELFGKNKKIMILLDREHNVAQIAKRLCDAGYSDAKITVGSALGTEKEQIICGTAGKLCTHMVMDLAILLVETE